MKKKIISRAVLILSMVSLFTDIASEMLYPVMPIYLKSIGFSVILIGILEGVAEAITGISKGYFGNLSDQIGKRVPFIRNGYFLSALSKPMMAILTFPWWIFAARTMDRLGKGIRTSARDALLADESTKETKASVFGFHRAMDTLGATIGPLIALIWLFYNPQSYKLLFIFAFLPGLVAVLFTFLIKEKTSEAAAEPKKYSFFNFVSYWKISSSSYRALVVGLLAFTFFNSSDVFLLLMLKEKGFSDYELILVYVFYNLIYALFSFPLGIAADKIGIRKMYLIGLMIFCTVYLGMAFNNQKIGFYIIFFMYGIYAASTEGISKAWLSSVASRQETATALGFYGAFNSLMTILASTIAGILWSSFSPFVTFAVSAAGVGLVTLYFIVNKKIRI